MWRAGAIVCFAAAAIMIFSCPVFSYEPAASDEQVCDMRADAALGLEDYPTAIMLHRDWLRTHPDDALAHYHLGFAYGMTGRSNQEMDEYRKAAMLGLRNWDLFINLGLAYAARGELPEAAAALEHATLLAPKRAEPHFNLALVYEAEHQLGAALAEITVAHQLKPQDQDIENANAVLCVETGDLRCARRTWTQLAHAGYSPARENLAILTRIMCPRPSLSSSIGRSPLATERQCALSRSRED